MQELCRAHSHACYNQSPSLHRSPIYEPRTDSGQKLSRRALRFASFVYLKNLRWKAVLVLHLKTLTCFLLQRREDPL